MVFKERFQADVFHEFLSRLVRQGERKVFIIVDRHPVHRFVKVKRWLTDNEEHIRLFFLPSYSPELNPDEVLNQDVKSNAVGGEWAHTQHELIASVRSFLWG